MTARLAALGTVAALLKDQRLNELRQAAARIAETQALIAGLAVQPAPDLSPLAAARAALGYAGWAEKRRRELDAILRVQLAEMRQKQAAAAQAFGRAQVLERLLQEAPRGKGP